MLRDRIETDLYEILYRIADAHNFTIVELNGEADHVHLLVECTPQHYLPDMPKGVSTRRLFERHPELKKSLWGGHLWNPSCFVAMVSEQTEDQMQSYIQMQKEK